ncbi:MAG: DNA-binding protein [Lactobacillales bacterium]|jgi:predicted RNA-binding protein (virulence factor B family)|nr:DNA-binding protein [Lactobacillales bacterium]
MNELIATSFAALITNVNDDAYFVQKNGQTFRIDREENPDLKLGDSVEVFAFTDRDGKPVATTKIPLVTRDTYGFSTVVGVRRDLGVFVDIGLPDREVALSLDELSAMKNLWPKEGDKLMVKLLVDNKGRIWATLAPESEYRARARKLDRAQFERYKNKEIIGTVFRLKMAGTFVLTQDYRIGYIHPSERFNEPRLGEELKVRVIGYNTNGWLNLSLKPRAHEAMDVDADMIYNMLERAEGGHLPYNDKTAPEVIDEVFGISKGGFKKAIGRLFKAKKIIIDDQGIKLNEKTE